MERGVRLLLVDSDERRRTRTRALLEDLSLELSVAVATTPEEGIERLREDAVDCVVSAFDLDDGDGLSFLDRLREDDESTPFILFAEDGSPEVMRELYARDRTDYVPNVPGAEDVLGDRIRCLLEARESTPGSRPTQRQELARERERFSDLFSNFSEPTIASGFRDGVTVFKAVNDAFEDVFGLQEDEIQGESVNELIVPEEIRAESQNIDDQIGSGDMVDRVVRRLAADGPRLFNLRSIPVNVEGEIDGFAVYSDITERKRRERELERYETIVQTISMGVLTVNDDWQVGNVNAPGAEMLGYSVDELVDEPFARLRDDGVISQKTFVTAGRVIEDLRSGAAGRKTVVEATIHPRSDATREIEVHTSLLPSDDGEFSGAVFAFHDITERKDNERELKRQNERLEEFASIVSHDLRNPLNVAMGHLEIVGDECDSPSVDHVADALDRMEVLIRETLQLAKQGEMVTETEPIRLSDIVDDCWGMIDRNDATLERTGDVRFRGDPSRVRQLFENLFRNAVEHGSTSDRTSSDDAIEHGDTGVTVRVGFEDGAIVVADDGPGVPPEERERIFETGHTTSADGTGFGLAIVGEIVDAHDWEIAVGESWAGGARFEITGFERAPS